MKYKKKKDLSYISVQTLVPVPALSTMKSPIIAIAFYVTYLSGIKSINIAKCKRDKNRGCI